MTFPAIACKPRFIDDSSMRDDLHAYACTWNARQRLGLLSMDRQFLYRSLGILYSGQPREISTAQPCNMGNILFDSTQPTQLYIGWNCAIFILITVEVFSDKLIGESKSNILTSSIRTRTYRTSQSVIFTGCTVRSVRLQTTGQPFRFHQHIWSIVSPLFLYYNCQQLQIKS